MWPGIGVSRHTDPGRPQAPLLRRVARELARSRRGMAQPGRPRARRVVRERADLALPRRGRQPCTPVTSRGVTPAAAPLEVAARGQRVTKACPRALTQPSACRRSRSERVDTGELAMWAFVGLLSLWMVGV